MGDRISMSSVQTIKIRRAREPRNLTHELSPTTHKRVLKPMGFKIASSGDCPCSKFWLHQQFGTRLGGFFGTQKGIKTDGSQNGKFWGLSKLETYNFGAPTILVPACVFPISHESARESAHGSVHEDVHGNAHEG